MPKSTPSSAPADTAGAASFARKVSRAKKITSVSVRDGGVIHAKAQSFGARVSAFAKEIGQPGFAIPGDGSPYPFQTMYDKKRFADYDGVAQSFIAEALKFAGKGVVISGNEGTSPELALLGAHLVTHNFHFGINLFHQSVPLYGLRARGRPFIVDVAASYGGVLYLYPVDGAYFHLKSMTEVLDSQRRNWLLESAGGVVVPIVDTQCYNGEALRLLLREHGAPV